MGSPLSSGGIAPDSDRNVAGPVGPSPATAGREAGGEGALVVGDPVFVPGGEDAGGAVGRPVAETAAGLLVGRGLGDDVAVGAGAVVGDVGLAGAAVGVRVRFTAGFGIGREVAFISNTFMLPLDALDGDPFVPFLLLPPFLPLLEPPFLPLLYETLEWDIDPLDVSE
jgi:hypothetical protein